VVYWKSFQQQWFNIQQKECSAVVRSIRIFMKPEDTYPGGTEVSLPLAQACGVLLENGLAWSVTCQNSKMIAWDYLKE
jgi:hypothetical protein